MDFESTFDKVRLRKIMNEFKLLGMPNVLQMCLINTKAKVRFQGIIMAEFFFINKGVIQCDSISPTLFNLIQEGILRKAGLNQKIL